MKFKQESLSKDEFVEFMSCVSNEINREFAEKAEYESKKNSVLELSTPLFTVGATVAFVFESIYSKKMKLEDQAYDLFIKDQERYLNQGGALLKTVSRSLSLLKFQRKSLIPFFSKFFDSLKVRSMLNEWKMTENRLTDVESLEGLLKDLSRHYRLQYAEHMLENGIHQGLFNYHFVEHGGSGYAIDIENKSIGLINRMYGTDIALIERAIEKEDLELVNKELKQAWDLNKNKIARARDLFELNLSDRIYKNSSLLIELATETEIRAVGNRQKETKRIKKWLSRFKKSRKALLTGLIMGSVVSAWYRFNQEETSEQDRALNQYLNSLFDMSSDQTLTNQFFILEKEGRINEFVEEVRTAFPQVTKVCKDRSNSNEK